MKQKDLIYTILILSALIMSSYSSLSLLNTNQNLHTINNSINSYINNTNGELSQIASLLSTYMNTTNNSIAIMNTSLNNELDAMNSNTALFNSEINALSIYLNNSASNLQSQIDALNTTLANQSTAFNVSLANQNANLTSLAGSLTNLNNSLNSNLNTIYSNITSLNQAVSQIPSIVTSLNNIINTQNQLEASLTSTNNNVTLLQNTINSLPVSIVPVSGGESNYSVMMSIWNVPITLNSFPNFGFGSLFDTFDNNIVLQSNNPISVQVLDFINYALFATGQEYNTIAVYNGTNINFWFNDSAGCAGYVYVITTQYNDTIITPNVTAIYNPAPQATGECANQ